ncbi:MAG: PhoH family protein [Bacteroidales bacterium]|jgi:phosphate starvation-inducible PhoH-like protein|nr:PhoH family protein [Bacteroidales bacterium]MDI9544260.1 PhoH family protein [Bacteroidota bacterium]NLV37942.1 PhoH family protein [Bacteroidales bacterium]HNZ80794.1 PhoH family protein [Bacteroidales bacterium]HOD27108.1 PhoH family protein [Bacteroidales bacterium]
MNEKILFLEQVDPSVFCGVNNSHIKLLKDLYPKLRIIARGNVIKILGEEAEIARFEQLINHLQDYLNKYNLINQDVITQLNQGKPLFEPKQENLILYGVNGKPILARTINQQKLVKAYENNDLLFAVGPAGTGKTYTAIALAVRAFKNKEVRKIILSRPAVEAGEKLGFLPGDMKEKVDPYLQPLYDALEDMIPPFKLREYMENKQIQIAPLAFMRGRTLNDAVIILDEAQNTTGLQIKMFLTRLGLNAKMIVTGDLTQIDLPAAATSGLVESLRVLNGIEGIGKVEFDVRDIVRHKLVQHIVEAYEDYHQEQKKLKNTRTDRNNPNE